MDTVGYAVKGNARLARGRLESAHGALDDGILRERSAYVIDRGGGALLGAAVGSYRLEMDGDETVCIPWHASAREVQDAVAALPAAADVGGPTVAKRGDGARRWRFGFRYEVAWDRAEAAVVPALTLGCLGSADGCGCADAVSRQRLKPTGWCETGVAQTAVATDGRLCLTDVAVEVDRVVVGGETAFTDFGTASLEIRKGWHTLPATMVPPLRITGPHARAVIACRAADYERLFMEDGSLTFAGPGFEGDDAAALLFGPPWATWRGALSLPAWSANRDYGMAHSVAIKSEISGGDIRVANPRLADADAAGDARASLSFFGIMLWTGNAGFRGNGIVTLKSSTTIGTCYRGAVANGCDVGSRGDGLPDRYEPAHLRDAVTLVLAGQTAWAQGHILLGEGARLVTDADLEVVDDADFASPGLLATARDATPGRQEDARNGWYTDRKSVV